MEGHHHANLPQSLIWQNRPSRTDPGPWGGLLTCTGSIWTQVTLTCHRFHCLHSCIKRYTWCKVPTERLFVLHHMWGLYSWRCHTCHTRLVQPVHACTCTATVQRLFAHDVHTGCAAACLKDEHMVAVFAPHVVSVNRNVSFGQPALLVYTVEKPNRATCAPAAKVVQPTPQIQVVA